MFEELGKIVHFALWFSLVAMVVIPVLLVVILVLLIF